MTISELKQRMTSREFAEWIALFRLEHDENLERDLGEKALAKLKAHKKAG